MDTNWCAYCQKHVDSDGLYCSEDCENLDLAQVQAAQFDIKQYSFSMNDITEARESSFLRPLDEPIPKLSEVRASKRSNLKTGFAAMGKGTVAPFENANLPDDVKQRQELDQTRDFLRSYQRRRIWSSPSVVAQSYHQSSMSKPQNAKPRAQEHPAFFSMSIPVLTTELDPALFLRTPHFAYGTRKYERDNQYAEQLMKQPWFSNSESSVH